MLVTYSIHKAISAICAMNPTIYIGVTMWCGRPALIMKNFPSSRIMDVFNAFERDARDLALLRTIVELAADLRVHHERLTVHGCVSLVSPLAGSARLELKFDMASTM